MKNNIFISLSLMVLLAVGCARELDTEVQEQESVQETVDEQVQAIVPGQAMVKFDEAMIELIC